MIAARRFYHALTHIYLETTDEDGNTSDRYVAMTSEPGFTPTARQMDDAAEMVRLLNAGVRLFEVADAPKRHS